MSGSDLHNVTSFAYSYTTNNQGVYIWGIVEM